MSPVTLLAVFVGSLGVAVLVPNLVKRNVALAATGGLLVGLAVVLALLP